MMRNELKMLIRQKYDSETALARDLGWSRQKLNRITNGHSVPTLYDAAQLAEQIGVPVDQVVHYFLPN